MKPYYYGFLAAFGLLGLYTATMTLLSNFATAIEQFAALWFLYVPLAIGFGIQVGLYIRLKQAIQQKAQGALAAGGTSAGAGMLACCAHHATDVLPILGLSALAALIARYQIPILIISIGINIVGTSVMWNHARKMI